MSSDASALSQSIAALSQPFRLNLARASHEAELSDYRSNTVLIEPLATMAAVEDFLYSRIQHRRTSNSQAHTTGAAEGKATTVKTESKVQTSVKRDKLIYRFGS